MSLSYERATSRSSALPLSFSFPPFFPFARDSSRLFPPFNPGVALEGWRCQLYSERCELRIFGVPRDENGDNELESENGAL